jgi:transposase-like protein
MPKNIYCLKCGTYDTHIKHGITKNGTQRYRCKECGKTFILNASPQSILETVITRLGS